MPEQTISQSQLQSLQGEHTAEPLSIPIDYNDPTAIDPGVGAVLVRQADWDDYLTKRGASAFKHVNEVVGALPYEIRHTVALNLAAGVHRPSGRSGIIQYGSYAAAFDLQHRTIGYGSISLRGVGQDDYDVLVEALTITAHQVDTLDPYLDFAGTPFSGMDLHGKMVRLSTGQLLMIHEHTDNRLSVLQKLDPAPVNGTTTATVVRPATILRNATVEAPTTKLASTSCVRLGDLGGSVELSTFIPGVFDVRVEAMGALHGIYASAKSGLYLTCVNVVMDHEEVRASLGVSPYGRDFQVVGSVVVVLDNCSGYADAAEMGTRSAPVVSAAGPYGVGGVDLKYCYFANSPEGLTCLSGGSLAFSGGVVLDNMGGTSWAAVDLYSASTFTPCHYSFFPGKRNVVRNCKYGVSFGDKGETGRADQIKLNFESITDACVILGTAAIVDVSQAPSLGFVDGGSNTGVGIRLTGPGALCKIPVGTDVEGTTGAIELADGSYKTYAELDATGLLSDVALNVIARG